MAISLTDEKNTVYGKGDVCLKISPFDNFRKFTLYENWKNNDRKTINISSGQKLFLVFKTKKKEIRIPEYNTTNSGITIDKVNGEVLFKISKKNAIDILSLDDKTFYITRVYETTDMTGDNVTSSDEEVIYTGQWKDESSASIEDYTSKIKTLLNTLNERNQQISNLQASNAALMEQNVNLATQIEDLKNINNSLSSEVSTLEAKVAEYESGEIYDATVLDNNGTTIHISSEREYTEDELKNVVKTGLETLNI